jgi:hypothetical protein
MIGSLHIILIDYCWLIKAHDIGYVREFDVVVDMYPGNSLSREGKD